MTEPTPEEQAKMQLLLDEKITEIVRREIKSAFADMSFASELGQNLSSTFMYTVAYRLSAEPQFVETVRAAMKRILDKW